MQLKGDHILPLAIKIGILSAILMVLFSLIRNISIYNRTVQHYTRPAAATHILGCPLSARGLPGAIKASSHSADINELCHIHCQGFRVPAETF